LNLDIEVRDRKFCSEMLHASSYQAFYFTSSSYHYSNNTEENSLSYRADYTETQIMISSFYMRKVQGKER